MNYKWPLMQDTITPLQREIMSDFCLTTDRFTNGPKCRQFEEDWSKWLGAKYSTFVSSGSTANFLLVAAVKEFYDLKNGDQVIVPACTWMTNVAPIMQLGLHPIFCDIETDTYSFCLDSLRKIKEQDKYNRIKMIFVSHLLGFRAPIEQYKEIFPKTIIIEDICESHGIIDEDGNRQGSNSLGATFSFYFGHHMTTIEGGMISTNNPEIDDLIRMKRSHGMARESKKFDYWKEMNKDINPQFLFVTDGYNFRSSELNAVLGIEQLRDLSVSVAQRRMNYEAFWDFLPEEHFYKPAQQPCQNSSFCFPLVAKEKKVAELLAKRLEAASIETRPVISGNLLRHPFLKAKSIPYYTVHNTVDVVHDHGIYCGNNQFVGKKELELLKTIVEKTV